MRQIFFARKTRQVWIARWALAALTLLVALAIPVVTLAHPLGNFTVNHYSRLELRPGQVRVFYVLDMAEIPTIQTTRQIDQNGDQQINADEGAAYATAKMDELRWNLRFTLNGTPVDLQPAGAPELSFPLGQGGLSLLRLTFWLEGALPTGSRGAVVAEYRDNNELERIGWREIVVRGQGAMRVFDATVLDKDQSNELRAYPQDMLSSPLNETSARFSFQPVGTQAVSQVAQAQPLGSAANDGAFAALITLPRLDLRVVLLALATALGLGGTARAGARPWQDRGGGVPGRRACDATTCRCTGSDDHGYAHLERLPSRPGHALRVTVYSAGETIALVRAWLGPDRCVHRAADVPEPYTSRERGGDT